MPDAKPSAARDKLIAAATALIRAKGYAGTSVDELCRAAGVTKGAFFHHFPTKEALAVAAAQAWTEMAAAVFGAAPFNALSDPLDRVLGYLAFRRAILVGGPAEFTCLAGTLIQETYCTHPAIGEAAAASVFGHAASLEADIAAAMARYGAPEGVTPESLALHFQAVLQGAFILAKAAGGPERAADSIDHLRRYVQLLFPKARNGGNVNGAC